MNDQEQKMQAQLQQLHIQLQDLLAGYADNMLDEQQMAIVEAHLAGCEACRMDLARQQSLCHRLNDLPLARMPAQLHQRLDAALNEAPAPQAHRAPTGKSRHSYASFDWLGKIFTPLIATASGWSVALVLLTIMFFPQLNLFYHREIPMVQDVLTQYRQLIKTMQPTSTARLADSPPATWPNSRVLTSWKTTIGGAPADAFAVRHGDAVVFVFRIDEVVFFRNPDVRLAVANQGQYQIENGQLAVVALPLKGAGLLMVGPPRGLPSPANITFKTI